jgi:hypothetical protein
LKQNQNRFRDVTFRAGDTRQSVNHVLEVVCLPLFSEIEAYVEVMNDTEYILVHFDASIRIQHFANANDLDETVFRDLFGFQH